MQANVVTFKALKNLINKQKYIEIPSHGVSMLPFIRSGNLCRFEPVDPSKLARGDIVLFLADNGTLVGHRYIETKTVGKERMIVCKGDSNLYPDSPVPYDRVIGKMISIQKSSGPLLTSSPGMKLWGKLVIRLPLLSLTIHSYLRVVRKLRGMKNSLWAS
ncbi:signal peptidase I [Paenibacillus sp. P26]|nr:signal peptidase I [Paenibacillus sp. P26]UUZ93040.1 signal peptidase I [Paenibacillus sp. P25]